ncbi:MAG: hypothetical protein PHO15_09885 [Eubacteriales bacterium]|nr:hypothetical protein [Eubacteriales bacterium]
MEISRHEITAHALELGFGDVRFARADGSIKTRTGSFVPVCSILRGATCLIVLFADYLPAANAPESEMALSAYYVASNAAYHASKKLAEYLQTRGAQAVHTTDISAKAAALLTGGFLGDNGFYYHERFGSYVCIQMVLTDAVSPADDAHKELRACLHCGACAKACPSGAVGNIQNCLRYHSNTLIPEALRGDVYQLLGCEKCQSVCPNNSREKSAPHTFRLDGLLNGMHMDELKILAGKNYARPMRILSQSVLYAANTRAYHLAEAVKALCTDTNETVRTHALWAYEKLTGNDDR